MVRDADGNITEHVVIHNTSTAALLDAVASRLATVTTTADGNVNGLIYDNLQLCTNDAGGGTCALVGSLEDLPTLGTSINPVDPGNATLGVDAGGGDTTGTYEVVDTFFCITGGTACSTIEELQLTGGGAIQGTVDTGVGAFQDVSVTLNDNDSIQVTWTIDLDDS